MEMQFPEVKHVILDEVQNYRKENGDWLKKARKLVRRHSRHNERQSSLLSDSTSESDLTSTDSDFGSGSDPYVVESVLLQPPDTGAGFLWLFIDSNQLNHKYSTGIPNENAQHPSFHLTKVIRNSKCICKRAKKCLSVLSASLIEMGHNFKGEKCILKTYIIGDQINSLKELLCSLLDEGYSKGDIAILFGKKSLIPKRHQLDIGTTVDARRNDSEFVVFSTLRKYSGLERPVVIIVNIKKATLPPRSDVYRSLYCAITRAMVKVVFLYERCNT